MSKMWVIVERNNFDNSDRIIHGYTDRKQAEICCDGWNEYADENDTGGWYTVTKVEVD